ncbi:MAG: class I SAM-dependent methyltransferase [Lysobacter sp.]|nr:class I SAM-dependent methyltransferase [Lysobacter sp.]
MKECSKSIARRLADPNFSNRYFVGSGIDIGGKPDPLALYVGMFSRMTGVKTWDWEDGDAQYLQSAADGSFDFVHSSHCLEHLVDPREGLKHWFRVLKPGGYLVLTVPDEDLYEQGVFPSTFNRDHKWTFTVYKPESWSDRSINLLDLARELGADAEVVRIEQLSSTYRFDLPRFDQTLTPVGECGIEMVVRKRPTAEVEARGRWQRPAALDDRELRIHFNQYRQDMQSMKSSNQDAVPFQNDSPL